METIQGCVPLLHMSASAHVNLARPSTQLSLGCTVINARVTRSLVLQHIQLSKSSC